jgi:hypothetical protein
VDGGGGGRRPGCNVTGVRTAVQGVYPYAWNAAFLSAYIVPGAQVSAPFQPDGEASSMPRARLLLVAALMGLLVQACSSPTLPPYPTPDETGSPKPPPNRGFTPAQP